MNAETMTDKHAPVEVKQAENRPCGYDFNLLMIKADIASGKATVRSLGALYMVAMANRHARGNLQNFADINAAISDYRCPDGTAVERAMALEPVKKIAWALYEGACALKGVSHG